MTQPRPTPGDDLDAADAINRVLDTERRAREAVNQCEARAAANVVAARARVRYLQERTDTRISRLHTCCEREIARRVAELDARAETVRGAPPGDDARLAHLAEAVATLAAQLTE